MCECKSFFNRGNTMSREDFLGHLPISLENEPLPQRLSASAPLWESNSLPPHIIVSFH